MAELGYDNLVSMESRDAAFFRALPEEAVRHRLLNEDMRHNAIWDMAISREGRVFFSLCAELAESRYVRLYEYLPDENAFRLHFRLEDRVIVQDREIRVSKIHTSMAFMEDGRLIMTTHTTSQAPQHPTWMAEGYYQHLWEGFPGSHLLLYDPETGILENRGIPAPHETLYGGTYDPLHRVYYCGGMIRGHAYACSLDDNRVTDLGQVTEFGAYRWVTGPDGHVYSSSRTGRLFRIRTDTRQVEELGISFPRSSFPDSLTRNQLNGAKTGPDGRLYMQVVWGDCLFAYDCAQNRLDNLGSYAPAGLKWPHKHWMVGLHFDTEQVLWYGLFLFNALGESAGCRLCSWDILRGGEPVDHGFIASDLRGVHTLSEVEGRGDRLYICDGNHLFDRCGMLCVDLAALRQAEAAGVTGPLCHDAAPYLPVKGGRELYPYDDFEERGGAYLRYMNRIKDHWQFYAANSESMSAPDTRVVRLWERVGFGMPVRALSFAEDGSLTGVCGQETALAFTIRDGALTDIRPADGFPPAETIALPEGTRLPAVPGRQYLAEPSAAVRMGDGSLLVGTKDGMLCRIQGERVFALGMACFNGPIHQLATDREGRRVFGVAGHELDLGMIFEYDDERGLRWRGRNYVYTAGEPYMALSSEPVCCALSPDGEWLAVGVADRMSCVYLYRVGEDS